MLLLEHLEGLAQASAEAISNIKFDKVVVWDGGDGKSTSNFLNGLAHSMPPILQVIEDIGAIEMPEFLARLKDDGTIPVEGNGKMPTKKG